MGLFDFLGGGSTNVNGVNAGVSANPSQVADAGGGGFSDLFKNKLFLQMLSGAGSAMQQGEPVGPALNQVTQQNISAQNYAGLLKKLMGNALGPDETKATLSNKGIDLTIPQSELKDGSFLGGDPLGLSTPTQNVIPTPITPSQRGTASPFAGSQLDISASDLAGLTPQDISSALTGTMGIETLKQKKVSDLVDAMYKQSHAKLFEAQTGAATPSITIPGTNIKLTGEQYIKYVEHMSKDDRTTAVKDFEYAKKNGYTGTFTDYQDAKTTTNQKDYKVAVEGGYSGSFNKWLVEMKKAGSTNISIGTKLEEKKAMSELAGQLYFNEPKWTTELDKHMEKADFANMPGKAGSSEYLANVSKAKAKEKINFIEGKIIGGGGTIVGIKKVGKIGVWTVKWPSGDTKEIKYALDE